MIFVGYEPGSKGYQFWDPAHQCSKISCDVKFEETHFPAKESKLAQPILAPLSDCQIPESDNESDSSGLDLVTLAQPPTIPPTHNTTHPISFCIGTRSHLCEAPNPCTTTGTQMTSHTITRHGPCSVTTHSTSILTSPHKGKRAETITGWTIREHKRNTHTHVPGSPKFLSGSNVFTR